MRFIHVAKLSFNLILHEGNARLSVKAQFAQRARSDSLGKLSCVCPPMWAYAMLALVSGFFEATFTSGVAYVIDGKNSFKASLLTGRSARIIQTSGTPGFFYRLFYGAHGAKALRSMRHTCGIHPVRFSLGAFEDNSARRKRCSAKQRCSVPTAGTRVYVKPKVDIRRTFPGKKRW